VSEAEENEGSTEEAPPEEAVEGAPEAVPDDYLDPKPFDPAGR
jgi:hypothetical protein